MSSRPNIRVGEDRFLRGRGGADHVGYLYRGTDVGRRLKAIEKVRPIALDRLSVALERILAGIDDDDALQGADGADSRGLRHSLHPGTNDDECLRIRPSEP